MDLAEAITACMEQTIELVEEAGYKVLPIDEYWKLKGWSEQRELEEEIWLEKHDSVREEKEAVLDWASES